MNGNLVELNFRDDQSRAAVLNEAPVLNSEKFGWKSLYFEHRREQTLQTVEHINSRALLNGQNQSDIQG